MQRQRREEREADHDADAHEREPRQVAPGGQRARGGRRAGTAASTAATSARPRPTNVGSRSSTANRVAGSENENPRTPRKPQSSDRLRYRSRAVALLASSMPNSNTGAIVAALEAVVEAGAPGDRLPSVRELMARHRAGPATVQRAIAALSARGLVEARPGRGTFVAARAAPAVADRRGRRSRSARGRSTPTRWRRCCARRRRTRSCSRPATCPADLQPTAALGVCAGARGAAAGGVGPGAAGGHHRAARVFAAAVGATPGDVLICPGGQAGLAACLRGLAAPGAPVVVEAPTYLGALTAARAQGLVPVPVPADEHGVRPTCSPMRWSTRRAARLPAADDANPHGATLAVERRAAVLEAVRAAGAFLIEDDAFRDLASGRRRRRCSARTRTATSSTSARSPSRRRPGCGSARSSRAARRARGCAPPASSRTSTCPARCRRPRSSSSARPRWRAHLRRLRRVLRERRDALAAAGRARSAAGGRMNLWVPLAGDDRELAQRRAAAGVIVSPGRPFFAAEPPGVPAAHVRRRTAGRIGGRGRAAARHHGVDAAARARQAHPNQRRRIVPTRPSRDHHQKTNNQLG